MLLYSCWLIFISCLYHLFCHHSCDALQSALVFKVTLSDRLPTPAAVVVSPPVYIQFMLRDECIHWGAVQTKHSCFYVVIWYIPEVISWMKFGRTLILFWQTNVGLSTSWWLCCTWCCYWNGLGHFVSYVICFGLVLVVCFCFQVPLILMVLFSQCGSSVTAFVTWQSCW